MPGVLPALCVGGEDADAALAVGMFAAFKRFPRGDDPSLELYR